MSSKNKSDCTTNRVNDQHYVTPKRQTQEKPNSNSTQWTGIGWQQTKTETT
jgi:hypothetical protein